MSITAAQRAALEVVAAVLGGNAYLGGGVAIALRLNHRQSRDLDVFTPEDQVEALAEAFATVGGVRITGRAPGTLYLEVAGVPASVIRYRYPQLDAHEQLEALPVPLASVRDLICMKLSAIASRGALRDFWDLHAMLTHGAIGLAQALGWYQAKYQAEDIGHVVRSLAYFDDADAEPRPTELSTEHWNTVKSDFRRWVRALS